MSLTAPANTTLSSVGTNHQMTSSYRSCRPASGILPIINELETRNKPRWFLSNSSCHCWSNISRQQPFQFLDLPPEIRESIYKLTWGTDPGYYFSLSVCYPSISIRRLYDRGRRDTRRNALLFVSRQVSKEAAYVLYSEATLRIDSAPHRKLETLHFLGSIRTTWFISTTRRISIRSGFNSTPERNEAWVTGLRNFKGLMHLEVLLDFNLSVDESSWIKSIINLLPFTALDCQFITFRGHPNVHADTKRDVEAAWRDAVARLENPSPPVGHPFFLLTWLYADCLCEGDFHVGLHPWARKATLERGPVVRSEVGGLYMTVY
jgi:hypothetical protein